MTDARDILSEIRKLGVGLTPVGHRIRASGPLAGLDDELKRKIRDHRLEIIELLVSEKIPPARSLPISNIQQRMRLGAGMSVGTDHVRSVFAVEGDLEEDLLASAAQATVQRHPMLRTRFIDDQDDIRQVLGQERMIRIERLTVPHGCTAEEAIHEFVERPFSLAEDQLIRLGMLGSPGSPDRRLVVVVHHALADGQSAGILIAELARNYNLLKSGKLPVIPANQGAVIDEIENFQRGSVTCTEPELSEWVRVIGTDSTGSLPPSDEAVLPPAPLDFGLLSRALDPQQSNGLNEMMASESCSFLAVGLATTCTLLARTTGEERIILGLAVSERRGSLLEDAISNLAVDIVVRIDVRTDDSFSELLRTCQREILSALERPSVPMEALLERGCLDPVGRRRLRLPLAIATYERRESPIEFDGADLVRMDNSHPNPFLAMGIRLINEHDRLKLNLEWDRTTFTDERAERLAHAFMTVLGEAVVEPNRPIGEFDIDDSLREGTKVERTGTTRRTSGETTRPSSILATHVASIWSDLLNVHPVQMTDRFFEKGGNSLQLIRMIDRLEQTIGTRLGIGDLMGDPTLDEMIGLLQGRSEALEIPPAMWLNKDRGQPRIFCIAGIGGLATFSFRGVADHLEGRASLVGIQLPGIGGGRTTPNSIGEIARWTKDAILSRSAEGAPIRIAGYSAGGVIGIEASRLLREEGHELERIILNDTLAPVHGARTGLVNGVRQRLRILKHGIRMRRSLKRNARLDLDSRAGGTLERDLAAGLSKTKTLLTRHVMDDCTERLLLLNSRSEGGRSNRSKRNADAWNDIAKGGLETIDMHHSHIEMMNDGSRDVGEIFLSEIGQAGLAD